LIDEIQNTFSSLFKGAHADFKAGKYTSPRIIVVALPVIFVVVLVAIIMTTPSGSGMPVPEDEGAEETKGDKQKNE
jgi:hypothetical protein